MESEADCGLPSAAIFHLASWLNYSSNYHSWTNYSGHRMAEVDAFITEYLTLDPSTVLDSPIPALLSARIISNHLTLLSLVNSLQSSLLSDNPTTLTRAITLLARTITSNAAHQWDRNQVKTLISFFVGKLLDLTLPVDVLQESIEAIRFLLKQKSCGTAESIEIVNAFVSLLFPRGVPKTKPKLSNETNSV